MKPVYEYKMLFGKGFRVIDLYRDLNGCGVVLYARVSNQVSFSLRHSYMGGGCHASHVSTGGGVVDSNLLSLLIGVADFQRVAEEVLPIG